LNRTRLARKGSAELGDNLFGGLGLFSERRVGWEGRRVKNKVAEKGGQVKSHFIKGKVKREKRMGKREMTEVGI